MNRIVIVFLLACWPNPSWTTSWSAEVRLRVSEPSGISRRSWPVTSGVPLARGALRQAGHTALFDDSGKPIPLQTEALARWPDGSIRWLLLDFLLDLRPRETAKLVLRYGENVRRRKLANPLQVSQTKQAVTLFSGPLKLEVPNSGFRLLDRVWLDRNNDGRFSHDERITSSQGAGVELTTLDGKVFRSHLRPCEVRIEQTGPLRACIRIEGDHAGESGKMFRYVVRLYAYRGQPFVRLDYTFINDHKPQWLSKIKSLELVFARAEGEGESQATLEGKRTAPAKLFQVDDRRFEINGSAAGKRAAGWAAVGDKTGGLAVGVRKFWQNWPKSLEVGQVSNLPKVGGPQTGRLKTCPTTLRVGVCPSFPEGFYDGKPIREEAKLYYYLRGGAYAFKIGAARTHELWVHFLPGSPDNQQLGDFYRGVDQPLLARCDPQYVLSTRAAGRIPPVDPKKYLRYDAWLDQFFQLHLEDQEEVREYGLLNYGDWYNINWDSWGNLEYDMPRCFFAQYLRGGDRRYFDRAEQAARHFIDVDIVHAVNEELRRYGGSLNIDPGGIWAHSVGHTGGYYGRYVDGEYHDEAPLVMKGAYQLGLTDLGHVWIGGAFDYYLLTGDRRALEVAVMASDAMARRCPTRYTDHIRGVGWPLNMMLDAYEATGQKKYLGAASRQWEVLKKHLDPEKGWRVMLAYGHCSKPGTAERCRGQNAYMLALTLSGLARYHRITQDPAALAGLTTGVKQLIRECWHEKTNSFYLTSCIHNRPNPPPPMSSATFLSSQALAYESEMTGNREHRRILREAMRTGIHAGFRKVADREQHGQTGYASMLFRFTPYALYALEEDVKPKTAAAPSMADLFVSGKGGYHTYRIPSLIATKSGALLAICEGRKTSRADHGDVDLICRRSADGGRTWGPARRIYEEGGEKKITIGNPCPVLDQETGVIWLPFTRDNDDVLLVHSKDEGQTWSAPRVMTSSVKKTDWTWYATGPGNGIQLTRGAHQGRLVIPCDHRVRSIADRSKSTRSHVIYSDDHGRTWRIGGLTEFLMNECAVAQRSDSSLLLNMRSNRGRQRRAVATSTDGGLSWSKCSDDPALIEPVCQASMIRYTWPEGDEKSRLLFCNPASNQGRRRLTVRVSYDEGRTWPQSRLLYHGSAAYSSLAVLPGGHVGVLFERDNYGKITFVRLSRQWLEPARRRGL